MTAEAASSPGPSGEHRGEKHRQGSDPVSDRIAGGLHAKSYFHKGESMASLLHRQIERTEWLQGLHLRVWQTQQGRT